MVGLPIDSQSCALMVGGGGGGDSMGEGGILS